MGRGSKGGEMAERQCNVRDGGGSGESFGFHHGKTPVDDLCLLHNLLLVDVVGPPSAQVCRTVANFPQVDYLWFINP